MAIGTHTGCTKIEHSNSISHLFMSQNKTRKCGQQFSCKFKEFRTKTPRSAAANERIDFLAPKNAAHELTKISATL